MDKKNIDELFREKFKSFREIPDEKVWTDIENSLDKKRKKRIIPLWWQWGGVAAVLAIALISFYSTNQPDKIPSTITDTEKTSISKGKLDGAETDVEQVQKNGLEIPESSENPVVNNTNKKDVGNDAEGRSITVQEAVGDSENSYELDSSNKGKRKNQKNTLHIEEKSRNALANSKNGSQDNIEESLNRSAKNKTSPNIPLETDVTQNDAEPLNDSVEKNFGTEKNGEIHSPEKIKLATNILKRSITDGDNTSFQSDSNNSSLDKDPNAAIVTSDAENLKNANASKVGEYSKTKDAGLKSHEIENSDSEFSNRAIAQSTQIDKNEQANDTLNKGGKKSIFEAVEAQNEEEDIAEVSTSRWSGGPNVAPVYFNALGVGSPIDPGLSPNAKSGSTNMSFGLSIAYAVSKKLSVRSGIHKTEYGYNTDNVVFSPTLAASNSRGLQNIVYAGGSQNLALNNSVSDSGLPESFSPEVNSLSELRDGNVLQQFGYLEIPLELDYALLDSRFGVNLVGGISSLFLTDNSVSLSSGELTTQIGEARNLNDINFSTNIGFGVNYKFTSKIQLNIEPVFKYQLNTFSNVSGNFRPFSIGVYSGLNFKL